MPKDHIEKIANNVIFFRKNLRGLNRIGIILLFIVIALLGYTIMQTLAIKEPVYFATTSDGRLLSIQPQK